MPAELAHVIGAARVLAVAATAVPGRAIENPEPVEVLPMLAAARAGGFWNVAHGAAPDVGVARSSARSMTSMMLAWRFSNCALSP
jgi:hypothetical protein